jgi:tetraacyldisaccharide 4'-kinase
MRKNATFFCMSLFDQTTKLLAKWAAGTPPTGTAEKLTAAALSVPAAAWKAAAKARGFAFEHGIKAVHRVDCPVISIGNLTAGGSGKTPLVLFLAAYLQTQGRRVAIVSRGYKRESQKPVVLVSNGEKILADRREAGDEPVMLAKRLPSICVVVSPRRYEGALLAQRECKADVILLDDGFQHRALHRDLDLVLWDSTQPMESAAFLPRGFLREDVTALSRAHALIFTRSNLAPPPSDAALERIRSIAPQLEIFHAGLQLTEFIPIRNAGSAPSPIPPPGPCGAFCGIGNPGSFFQLLEQEGISLVFRHILPDHHAPTEAELDEIVGAAVKSGARFLLVTEKDTQNLPSDFNPTLPLWMARAEMKFKETEVLKIKELACSVL